MKSKQSIPTGTKVKFSLEHLTENEFGEKVAYLEGYVAVVNRLATFSELGDKDYEYYDIQFIKNGLVLNAISGFHLEPI
jgi:hypothetical protein